MKREERKGKREKGKVKVSAKPINLNAPSVGVRRAGASPRPTKVYGRECKGDQRSPLQGGSDCSFSQNDNICAGKWVEYTWEMFTKISILVYKQFTGSSHFNRILFATKEMAYIGR